MEFDKSSLDLLGRKRIGNAALVSVQEINQYTIDFAQALGLYDGQFVQHPGIGRKELAGVFDNMAFCRCLGLDRRVVSLAK